MKKLFLMSAGVSALLVLLLVVAAAPAAAYVGATGQVIDADGNGWTHGGTVTLYEFNNATPVGTGSLDGTGHFAVAYTSQPGLFNTVYLVINYNAGPGGEPGTEQIEYTEVPDTVYFNAGYVETGTSPTAVQLQTAGATGTSGVTLALIAGLLLLASASFALLRRSH